MHKNTSNHLKISILLTSTIDPGSYSNQLTRNDPSVRIKDYKDALSFYLKQNDIDNIIYCDNSEYSLEPLKEIPTNNKKIEFISFNGNKKPDNVHYGYSELGIIDYAINNSKIINETDYFIKITGRLKITNISEIISQITENHDILIDCTKSILTKNIKNPNYRTRTQCIVFSKNFYIETLYNTRNLMPELGISHLEQFLAFKLDNIIKTENRRLELRFKNEPYIDGISGSATYSYHTSKYWIKYHIRKVARLFFPSLWL